jgi:hypothetical protein
MYTFSQRQYRVALCSGSVLALYSVCSGLYTECTGALTSENVCASVSQVIMFFLVALPLVVFLHNFDVMQWLQV